MGVRAYPKAARDLLELAEAQGWGTSDGLPARVSPDGLHTIRVVVGVEPGRSATAHGYQFQCVWTSYCDAHTQFALLKVMGRSTLWEGWRHFPTLTEVLETIRKNAR